MRFVLFAIVLAACADPSECELPPDTTTYNCEPIASGSGCMGGPRWVDETGSARQDDADKLFPIRCGAQFPFALAAFNREKSAKEEFLSRKSGTNQRCQD